MHVDDSFESERAPKNRVGDYRGIPPAPGWKKVFLVALADTGNVRAACHVARIGSQTVYAHKESDPEFRAEWDEALENATDLLELEARRRAMGQKDLDTSKVPASDTLMIFLLKAHRPEKFDPQRAMNALLRQIADNTAAKPRPE